MTTTSPMLKPMSSDLAKSAVTVRERTVWPRAGACGVTSGGPLSMGTPMAIRHTPSTRPLATPAGPSARRARGRSGGIGRSTSERAEQVSDDLRRRTSPHLRRRRRQTGLLLTAAGAMGLITLYQTGILRHLPDPPLPGMDSDKVDASGEAYESLKTPDATLGLASYGATLALIGMGAADRATDQPIVPLLAAAKIAADAAGAAWLTAEQVSKHRALCFYCLVASAATWVAVPLAVPEAREAWRALRS
jgi:uncharacterized membrane protein